MKHTTLFYVWVLTAAFAGNADAVLFKCTSAKGIVYQDRPCRDGEETDVRIVVPTGEVAPKAVAAQEKGAQGNARTVDSRAPASKSSRPSSDDPASSTKPADKRTAIEPTTAASADGRKKDATSDNGSVPMTAEQARNAEPSAKYYTTDAFSPGSETPDHMTCESPNGEKRRFLLTNGKLTSI